MAVTFAALAAYLLDFLLWNWSLAKVFIGDVGSTFLGAVFAGWCWWPPPCSLTPASACPAACWPHARVSKLYVAATALLAAALLLGGWPWVVGLSAAEFLAGMWLDQRVAVPFAVVSQS